MILVEVQEVYPISLTHDEIKALAIVLEPAMVALQEQLDRGTISDDDLTCLYNLAMFVEKLPNPETM